MVGRTLGHYEVIEPLGAGGMGEVYRAHDTTLKRDVAIKVLPEEVSADVERLARLEREAQLLAALNHPNIATIYGLEEAEAEDGACVRFMVLELVEGESLAERLSRGRIEVERVLGFARQIAEGLEAAHAKGIIHRDLKPGNVLITPEGQAKVLDFGLAKSDDTSDASGASSGTSASGAAPDLTESPTVAAASLAGVILGTAAYMSPEQARGKPLDRRTDIWSFGCVLYEMFSGERPFSGGTVTDVLAAIVEREPDWAALPADTPPLIRLLLRRCLEKAPYRRLHDLADARIEIVDAIHDPEGSLKEIAPIVAPPSRRRRLLPAALAGLAIGAIAAGFAAWNLRSSPTPVSHVRVEVQTGTYLWGGSSYEGRLGGDRPSRTAIALTPDGRALVYAATDGGASQLYLRRLEDPLAIPIAGTEGGSSPFLSPDGQRVGFVVGTDIRVVPLTGGESRRLLEDAPVSPHGPCGISWASEWIVFGGDDGIFRIPASGGSVEQLSAVRQDSSESRHCHPQLLPGGGSILFTSLADLLRPETAAIVAMPIGGEPVVVVSDGADGRYATPGRLVFVRGGALWAAGFNPRRLSLTSQPVRVVDDVMQAQGVPSDQIGTSAGQYCFSDSGSLAYASGGVQAEIRTPPLWAKRDGDVEPIPVPAGVSVFLSARLSPDGTRVAFVGPRFPDLDIFVLDLASGATSRLTLPGEQGYLAWSPDGSRLAFSSEHQAPDTGLYLIDSDLSGAPRGIARSDRQMDLSDWSVSGALAFVQGGDIWVVDSTGESEPEMFVGGPGREWWPAFSPDGRWLTYASDESGQWEVYVRPYPERGPVYTVTREGGDTPVWARDGTELFYRMGGPNPTGGMMAVAVDLDTDFAHGPARTLFDRQMTATERVRSYDVAPDGRFLVLDSWVHPPQPVTEVHLVVNWFEELGRLVPR